MSFSFIQQRLEILRDYEFFDTVEVHRDRTEYQLFTRPVGYPSGKCRICEPDSERFRTWADTNLILAGCLPAPQKFVLRSAGLSLAPVTRSGEQPSVRDDRFEAWKLRLALGLNPVFTLNLFAAKTTLDNMDVHYLNHGEQIDARLSYAGDWKQYAAQFEPQEKSFLLRVSLWGDLFNIRCVEQPENVCSPVEVAP